MSKEREDFERITESEYEGEFAKYADGEYVNEAQERHFLEFFAGYRAATTYYQPLLAEKDAELLTCKALLEQAREGLEGYALMCACEEESCLAYSAKQTLAAINAATGKGE